MLNYLTMKEASDLLPGNPSHCTVWRWCHRGVAIHGTRKKVKLYHIHLGRKMLTSQEWLEDFLTALDPDQQGIEILGSRPLRAGRKMSLAAAERILNEARI